MKIIQFFQELKETILDFIQTLESVKESLKEIRKTVDSMGIKTHSGDKILFSSVSGGMYEMQIGDIGLGKCYFTKEILNKEATNTKELFLIENDTMKKVVFKDGNQTKEVKEINNKFYLFK